MRNAEEFPAAGPSAREIAAAWACCAVVIIGASLANLGDRQMDVAITAYAGAHIPGGGGQRPPGPDADEPDGGALAETGALPDNAAPIVVSAADRPTTAEPAPGSNIAGRHCRHILRPSVLFHAAAARLADAGTAFAVREAVQ